MRTLEKYALIHRDFDVQAIDDHRAARFLQDCKARIEAEVLVIDFDFISLASRNDAG